MATNYKFWNKKLKPCPFCNSSAEILPQEYGILVRCDFCGGRYQYVNGGSLDMFSLHSAVSCWNGRRTSVGERLSIRDEE